MILTSADLADLPLSTSRTIDVVEFVDLEAIDPIYFDRTYYLEPQKAASKAYILLRDALHKSGHVAIAKVALRQRESLAVLRVYSDVLVLTTMLWPDEVRRPDFDFLEEEAPQVQPRELTMAGSLIDSLTEPVFEPDKFQDDYRAALEAKIEAKVAGTDTGGKPAPKAKREDAVPDLVDVLQASVDAAKRSRGGTKRAAKDGAKPTPTKSRRKTGS